MKHLRLFMKQLCAFGILIGSLAVVPSATAQTWEVGGGVGGSFFTSQSVKNALSSGDVTLSNAVAASFWLANNSSHLIGGELRYDYENTNLKLKSAGTSATLGADTHAFHYDFLLHFTPQGSRLRPFIAAGGGVKLYRGIGKESAFQPLSSLALLTKTSEVKPLISVGAGLKFAVSKSFQVRIEVRDALTPFPKTVIAPAQGDKIGGWLQDFVAMVGLSLTF